MAMTPCINMPVGRKRKNMERKKYNSTKKLAGAVVYRGWKNWDVGDILVGKLSRFIFDERYKNSNPVFIVEETFFKDKDQNLKAGTHLQLSATKILKQTVTEDVIGEVLQIELVGWHTVKTGVGKGKDTPLFEIDTVDLSSDEDTSAEDDL